MCQPQSSPWCFFAAVSPRASYFKSLWSLSLYLCLVIYDTKIFASVRPLWRKERKGMLSRKAYTRAFIAVNNACFGWIHCRRHFHQPFFFCFFRAFCCDCFLFHWFRFRRLILCARLRFPQYSPVASIDCLVTKLSEGFLCCVILVDDMTAFTPALIKCENYENLFSPKTLHLFLCESPLFNIDLLDFNEIWPKCLLDINAPKRVTLIEKIYIV